MPKQGFNDQWIEISRTGVFRDAKGISRDLKPELFAGVISNFKSGHAPIVVGHPENDSAPAYGWVTDLRLKGDRLEARFADTDENFEKLVEEGRFKKRSASFYLDPPSLRHVGFLGAQPPAIKGLRDIQFAEGESFAVESTITTINFKENEMDEKSLDQMPESFWEKVKAKLAGLSTVDLSEGADKGKDDEPAKTTSFSEADMKAIVEQTVRATTASFSDQIDELKKANSKLEQRLANGETSSRRSEIASFVESIPAERGRHFLKNAGIVEFLECLAVDDTNDEKSDEAISFSDGSGDDPQTHTFSRLEFAKTLIGALPPFIEFGEKFGTIDATKSPDPLVNSDRVKAMKAAAGVKED